jgi:hypothetical protein
MQATASRRYRCPWALTAVTLFTAIATTTPFGQGLSPATVEATLRPGESLDISKTVVTPIIPPRPDVCFLADTTGSMDAAITNVRTNATTIMNLVRAVQPDSQFCAAQYRDSGDTPEFQVDQTVTASTADVQTGINGWVADGGGDTPEGQLHALSLLGTAAGFRSGSTRIIVWFGDSSGHDPSIGGETLASTIAALQAAGARVIAIPILTGGDGLDSTGQATAIVNATGGVLINAATPQQATNAIIAGLTNLPVEVAMVSNCAAATGGNITTSFVPASQVVTSGTSAIFTETIHVSAGATEGATYTCSDSALLNGAPMRNAAGDIILETKTIHVRDVTRPSARCVEGPNPSGKNVPTAGGNGNSGQNPDGFYQLLASDNVGVASVVVCDSGSPFCSDPFQPDDAVKITQAPGKDPSDQRPGPGVIVSHLTIKGDAVLVVTDTSGNTNRAVCLVPPPPK